VRTSPATASTSTAPASSGATYKASFTHYGAGDSFGSPNCQTNTAACGFFTSPGFSAAVSQNLYGAGPGAGAGPACGTCWKLVGVTDSSGNALSNAGTSIVVMGKSAISFLQIPLATTTPSCRSRMRQRQRPPITSSIKMAQTSLRTVSTFPPTLFSSSDPFLSPLTN
jgi:hypothetical protein